MVNKSSKKSPKKFKLPKNVVERNGNWYVRVRYTDHSGQLRAIEEICDPPTEVQALLTRDEIRPVMDRKKRGLSDKAPPITMSDLCPAGRASSCRPCLSK